MTRLFSLLFTLLLTTPTLHAQWVQVTTPPDTSRILLASGSNLYATRLTGGIYLSTNNGSSWTNIGNGISGVYTSLLAANFNTLYARSRVSTTNDSSMLYVSTDNGTTWSRRGAGLPDNPFLSSFAFIGDSTFALENYKKVYLTTNNGTTWSDFSAGLLSIVYVRDLHIQNGYLYAGTLDDLPDSLLGGIYRRPLNGSANWSRCIRDSYPAPPFSPPAVNGIRAEGLIGNNDNLYCFYTFYNNIQAARLELEPSDESFKRKFEVQDYGAPYWYSTNFSSSNGLTFSIRVYVPEYIYPYVMVGDMIFGTGFSASGQLLGVVRYSGGNLALENWTPVNEGLPPNYELGYLVVCNGYLFGSNFNSGAVWRRPLSQLSTNNIAQTQPKQFELKQNYPNPFNPNTTIGYEIKTASTVSLKVYDLLGKEVSTLVNERKPAGTYQTSFNANNLSSGTYFYRLQAGDFIQTKRMTLLK